jgi:hypothetical protein
MHHGESKSTLDATVFMVNRRLLHQFESTMIVSNLVNSVGLISDMPNQCKLVNLDVDLDANFSTSDNMSLTR